MEIANRKVQMFRCYRPPLIGPTPKLAYVPSDSRLEAEMCEYGIYVREASGIEHMVPYANIESIRLEKQAEVLEMNTKRKLKPETA